MKLRCIFSHSSGRFTVGKEYEVVEVVAPTPEGDPEMYKLKTDDPLDDGSRYEYPLTGVLWGFEVVEDEHTS